MTIKEVSKLHADLFDNGLNFVSSKFPTLYEIQNLSASTQTKTVFLSFVDSPTTYLLLSVYQPTVTYHTELCTLYVNHNYTIT